MSDKTFKTLLQNSFGLSSEPSEAATLGAQTRIDARTCGFASDINSNRVEWMGMTPADNQKGTNSALWRIVRVEEEFNHYLSHVNAHDRIVDFQYNSESQALPIKKALERLAVWENAKLMRGDQPSIGQTSASLDRHYFRHLGIKHGYLISTTGEASLVHDQFPENSGKFLKSDLQAMREHREGFSSGDVLAQLIDGHDPITLYHSTIEEDMESFGDVNLFGSMHFFVTLLNDYAKIKLRVIEEFYANPNDINKETLLQRMNESSAFDQDLCDRYKEERERFGMAIFRMFHVVGDDWDEPLDFSSRDLRVEMLKNPNAQATYDYIQAPLSLPLTQDKLDAMLTISARGVLYFSQMLSDSSQSTVLERLGLYRPSDITDLLNNLDLLEIKFMYTELAQSGYQLPFSHEYRRIKQQKQELDFRIKDLKSNLRQSGDLSPNQEQQIDSFIKANAPIYMVARLDDLPSRLKQAHDYVAKAILPNNHQLSLPLDFTNCARERIAAPTHQTRQILKQSKRAAPKI